MVSFHHRYGKESMSVPNPMKAQRIHLKAGFFRKGKIIAPPNAEQLIKVTAKKPMKMSRAFTMTTNEQRSLLVLFQVPCPSDRKHASFSFISASIGKRRRRSSREKLSFRTTEEIFDASRRSLLD